MNDNQDYIIAPVFGADPFGYYRKNFLLPKDTAERLQDSYPNKHYYPNPQGLTENTLCSLGFPLSGKDAYVFVANDSGFIRSRHDYTVIDDMVVEVIAGNYDQRGNLLYCQLSETRYPNASAIYELAADKIQISFGKYTPEDPRLLPYGDIKTLSVQRSKNLDTDDRIVVIGGTDAKDNQLTTKKIIEISKALNTPKPEANAPEAVVAQFNWSMQHIADDIRKTYAFAKEDRPKFLEKPQIKSIGPFYYD